ncbi:MAG: hypothetical protein K8S98_02070 [Planctomycetes bacterium]|nr:hypothetical protein [Planctomycetota bacterium]
MTTVRFKIDLAKPKRAPKPRPPPVVRDPGPSRAARRLALAYWIERKIEAGELADYAAAARLLGVSRARMTQVVNMLLLPVELQEELLLKRRALVQTETWDPARANASTH